MNPLLAAHLALHLMSSPAQPSVLALLGGVTDPKGAPAAPAVASGGLTPDQMHMLNSLVSQFGPLLTAGPKIMAPAMAPTPTMYHPAAPMMQPFYAGGGQ